MTIFSKGFAPLLVLQLAFSPIIGQAWFFRPANAQGNEGSFADQIAMAPENAQNIALLTPSVAMASDRLAVDEDIEIQIADGDALVPAVGPSGTLADLVDIPPTSTISSYTVVAGDTVAAVAKRFGVDERTVRWSNSLKPTDVLHVGQVLSILPITGVKHTVVSGDTFATIAKKYKADASDIADYNNMEATDNLIGGTVVIVPNGEIVVVKTVTNAKTGKTTQVTVSGAGLKDGVAASAGYYIQPIKLNGSNIIKTQGFHGAFNGVDIAAPKGTPIRAMADGVVIIAKSPYAWNGGYGGLTTIQHGNGSQSLYAHQSKLAVSVGDRVTQGQIIGYVGNTGHVEGRNGGYHLHFEIRNVKPTPRLY